MQIPTRRRTLGFQGAAPDLDLGEVAVLKTRDARGADIKTTFAAHCLEDFDLVGKTFGLTRV